MGQGRRGVVAPPLPENRGPLPIIGYVEEAKGQSPRVDYEVYYLQPPNIFSGDIKSLGTPKGWYQCVTRVTENAPQGVDPVPVQANLSWEPDVPQVDSAASDACTTRDIARSSEIKSETVYVDPGTELITDSPIADPHGTVLVPAKPGNARFRSSTRRLGAESRGETRPRRPRRTAGAVVGAEE